MYIRKKSCYSYDNTEKNQVYTWYIGGGNLFAIFPMLIKEKNLIIIISTYQNPT